jgi:ABC-type lipoprotein export system ATPase subunit
MRLEMETFSIDKISIKNFKVFKDYDVDFSGHHIVVFSGPNGYGKTTLFDAFELAFTGNIDRFKDIESATGCDDILVSREQGKSVCVEVSISSPKGKFKIIRSLKPQYVSGSGNKIDKKAGNFENLWQLHIADENTKQSRSISQTELEKVLGQKELSRYYNLFYYVRQEDSAHFLKRSERERLLEISRLFDTVEEEKALKTIETAKKKVGGVKKNLQKNIEDLRKELNQTSDSPSNLPFTKLLPWADIPWDRDITIDDTKSRDNIISELHRILSIIRHRDEFVNNRKFLHVLSQTETINATIYLGRYLTTFSEVLKNYEIRVEVEAFLAVLDIDKLLDSEQVKTEPVLTVIPDFDTASFLSQLNHLREFKKRSCATTSICQKLLDLRAKLVEAFEGTKSPSDNECPLCGFDWGAHSSVIDEISKKKDDLSSFLSREESVYQIQKEDFVSTFIKPLRETLSLFISGEQFRISKSVYDAFKSYHSQADTVVRFTKWLSKNDIEVNDLLCDNLSTNLLLDKIVLVAETLKNRIKEKIPALSDIYQSENQLCRFESAFREYFETYDHLSSVQAEDVECKIQFVNSRYSSSLEKKRQLLLSYQLKISKVEKVESRLKKLSDIFKSEIGKHRRAIIKDIEIPFFIYSGKILQAIKEGSTGGVFVKDPSPGEELKNIRFVSAWSSDHDVINTTSSGQLSGIIIALTLAMNKVYSRGLGTIFIDDPVQTMDDINTVSLVDLLRHDFKDKQIFVSTHEDDFERYVLYKYLMHKRKVKKINVMTRREFVS